MEEIKDALDYGYPIDFSVHKDPHTLGSLLKAFLRELPEPLLTMEKYDDWMKASKGTTLNLNSSALDLYKIKELVDSLPDENKATFKFLIRFLKKVEENSRKNLMEANTVATVFSPTMLRPKKETNNTMGDTTNANNLLLTILENAYEFIAVYLFHAVLHPRMFLLLTQKNLQL